MIELLTGENDFELRRAIMSRRDEFSGDVEIIDGTTLDTKALPDIFTGQTLFSAKRLIVVSDLSQNSEAWSVLPVWAAKSIDDHDLTVLLADPKPDKRTSTYKWLKKHVNVHEYGVWSDRDSIKAEEWMRHEANKRGVTMTHAMARLMVQRVGLNQWELWHALEKLLLADVVNEDTIREIFEASADENVFELFETALRGDIEGVVRMIRTLRLTEDAYRVFGLLSGQVFQLVALVYGHDRSVAGDFSVSPYALNKLRPYAVRLQTSQAKRLIECFAKGDERLKTSQVDPWLVVEQSLIVVASET